MSDDKDKFKHSKRLQNDVNAIKKQEKIAKSYNIPVTESHRFHKQHVMNCGNPKCMLCSNPRKTNNELTIQEKRLFQNLDDIRYKKSNGKLIKETND